MKRASLVAIASAAVLFAGGSLDAESAGFGARGSGSGGAHVTHGGGFHSGAWHGGGYHHGAHVVVGAGFYYGWPGPYYWPGYYYAPAYYYAPPVYYAAPAVAEPEPQPPAAYWYYCAPLGAYYPYVQDCPAAWQPVAPHPY